MYKKSRSTVLQLVCQSLVTMSLLMASTQVFAEARTKARQVFKRIPTQYIAVLGEPDATSGTGAERWGLWRKDPGPRGVWFKRFDKLQSTGGIAPAKWQFDQDDWWLDENGLIMEKPDFSLPPGKYLVTGDRETISVLTVNPKDNQGSMNWELEFGAKLYDVTHLPCRSARYRPASADAACTPQTVRKADFPVNPGHPMPSVPGCKKQDYAVLFVIGMATPEQISTSANAACRNYGQKYPGLRILEWANESLLLCPDPSQTPRISGTPYIVRRADLRSMEDKSQRPRCNAKKRIESSCGTKELCEFKVNDDLCSEPEIARHTTHAQVEWKCRADTGWRFSRIERGQHLVFDCRE